LGGHPCAIILDTSDFGLNARYNKTMKSIRIRKFNNSQKRTSMRNKLLEVHIFKGILFMCVLALNTSLSTAQRSMLTYMSGDIDCLERESFFICFESDSTIVNIDSVDRWISVDFQGSRSHFIKPFTQFIEPGANCIHIRVPTQIGLSDTADYTAIFITSDSVILDIENALVQIYPAVSYIAIHEGELFFRAFDSHIDTSGSDYYTLMTTRIWQRGMSFAISKAIYNDSSLNWQPTDSATNMSSVSFTYTGENDLPAGTNICIVVPGRSSIGYGNPTGIQLTSGGVPMTEQFAISNNGTSAEIDIDMTVTSINSIILSQGHWLPYEDGFQLAGNELDGILISDDQMEYPHNSIIVGRISTEF
jgi:hypothetical protein